MNRRIAMASAVALLLAALLPLTGCRSTPTESSGQRAGEQSQTEPEISPLASVSDSDRKEASLYFQMRGEKMLARETRTIFVPKDKRLERVLIESLIEGPSASLLDLVGLFVPGTKVVSVSGAGELLTVTLNEQFLGTPADVPSDWRNDRTWRAEVLLRRQLALTSIVNTITEATDYTAVQLLIQDNPDSETGRRISRQEIFQDATGDPVLTPVTRDEQLILSHFNTARAILDSWMTKDYARLYHFAANGPTEAAFQQEMMNCENSLTAYSLLPGVVSSDGHSSFLTATLEYVDGDGGQHKKSYPIHLVLENGLWKMRYATMLRLMGET